jgi:hypothetical protein
LLLTPFDTLKNNGLAAIYFSFIRKIGGAISVREIKDTDIKAMIGSRSWSKTFRNEGKAGPAYEALLQRCWMLNRHNP